MKQNINCKKTIFISSVIIILLIVFFAGIKVQKSIYSTTISKVRFDAFIKELVGDDTCYVIGHKSPDTDTVCSAILLADILSKYGIKCEARISGKPNNETKFVLDNIGIAVPEIMTKADGKKIILVDHSEYGQMIDGMKNAKIIGIFDHHGVGNVTTNGPIVYEGLNVGATASIIYKIYKMNHLRISKKAASLIASAILSDTYNLTNSTTTEMDRYALAETIKISGIRDVGTFYQKMNVAAESYDGMTELEIFLSDYKEYDMFGVPVGIACVNAADRSKADEMAKRMLCLMSDIYLERGMKHLFAIIRNSQENHSFIVGYGEGVSQIIEQAFGSVDFIFKPAASRKKEIVPKLQSVYEKTK